MGFILYGFTSLVLVVCLLRTVSAVTHSMKYFYTTVSGDINFPEFTVVGLVDNGQYIYFDSNTQTAVPKTEWMKREGAEYWNTETQKFIGWHQVFKNNIKIVKDRFNQSRSTGVHTFQIMYGCEWDEKTGETGGFEQYGYDGEDFISFDLKTLTWIAPKQEAVISKTKLDSNRTQNEYRKHYHTQICIEWLKKYVDYGRSSLMKTAPPSVSLLQKTPFSSVTCHATGFYPSRVTMAWQKDGQDLHEDVEFGETFPNDDGTFQKSAHLTVNPEEWKNNHYQCVCQVSGIKEDFIKRLTEDEITRGVCDPGSNMALNIIVVVVILAVIAVVGIVIWKKSRREQGFVKANSTDNNSDISSEKA